MKGNRGMESPGKRSFQSRAFISFEYFAICDFMPILILSSLFTPKISSDKKCVLAESQIEIE